MSPQLRKQQLRAQTLQIRDSMDASQRIDLSLRAAELSTNAIKFDPGTNVSGFLPIRSEIDIRPLMDSLRSQGANLCLPVVLDKTTIVFRQLTRTTKLVSTGFGTTGPGLDEPELHPDILLIPLSVFDDRGGRIGYGAGHYDRAIANLIEKGKKPKLIGCGFECQRVDVVPTEPHDQLLHAMITETGYRCCAEVMQDTQ